MRFFYLFLILIAWGCSNSKTTNKALYKQEFLATLNTDSLVFKSKDNAYFDRYGEGHGSLYKFNKSDELFFYCFLNRQVYPYAEYYDEHGEIEKTEGKPSVLIQYSMNNDSSYTFSFLYSTFRKSGYKIRSIFSSNDTLISTLSRARYYSNIGGFDIVVRTREDVLDMKIINQAQYFDELRKDTFSFTDTVMLRDVIVE